MSMKNKKSGLKKDIKNRLVGLILIILGLISIFRITNSKFLPYILGIVLILFGIREFNKTVKYWNSRIFAPGTG